MRLTLRTLLAWMDGVLPADSARQLAEKVSGSAVAQTLAGRIRDVAARQGVGAPPADGRGMAADPNSAAEFLDNVLVAERLAEFERVCIESDMQLAEVADCHRLLADITAGRTVVGGVEAAVESRLREAVASEVHRLAAADLRADAAANARAIREALAAADDTIFRGVSAAGRGTPAGPAAAPRPSSRSWALAATAVAVLLGLVGVLGWSVMRGGRREVAVKPPAPATSARDGQTEPPAGDSPAESAVAMHTKPVPVPEAAPPVVAAAVEPTESSRSRSGLPEADDTPGEPAAAASVSPSSSASAPALAATQVPATPREPAPAPAPVAAAVAARVPQGEALAIATPAVAQPIAETTEPVPPVVPQASADAVVAGPFVLLLGRSPAVEQPLVWQARRAEATVPVPAELVSPPFSQPELVIDRVRIRLAPATRATLLRDPDGTPRLELLFGRAVVVAEDPAARLGVTAAGLSGRVVGGLEEPLGVEVRLEREPGDDPAATTATRRTRLVSAAGIVWEQTAEDGGPVADPLTGLADDGRIPAGVAAEWSSEAADAVVLQPANAAAAWLAGGEQIDPTDRQAAVALAARLPADEPVQPSLRVLAADPRGEQRVLAAATLALLGDYDEAVRQLAAEERGRELYAGQWAKLEALTVPLALARGANAAARLAKAFADQGPPGSGASLERLARGFSPADLAAGGDAWLVEALEDQHLVVRRYAFQRLVELANPAAVDRLRYRPDGRPEQRRAGVAWWREAVQQGRLRATAPQLP